MRKLATGYVLNPILALFAGIWFLFFNKGGLVAEKA